MPRDIALAIEALTNEHRAFARHCALNENEQAQNAIDRLADAAIALDDVILRQLNRDPPWMAAYPIPVQVFGRGHLPS